MDLADIVVTVDEWSSLGMYGLMHGVWLCSREVFCYASGRHL